MVPDGIVWFDVVVPGDDPRFAAVVGRRHDVDALARRPPADARSDTLGVRDVRMHDGPMTCTRLVSPGLLRRHGDGRDRARRAQAGRHQPAPDAERLAVPVRRAHDVGARPDGVAARPTTPHRSAAPTGGDARRLARRRAAGRARRRSQRPVARAAPSWRRARSPRGGGCWLLKAAAADRSGAGRAAAPDFREPTTADMARRREPVATDAAPGGAGWGKTGRLCGAKWGEMVDSGELRGQSGGRWEPVPGSRAEAAVGTLMGKGRSRRDVFRASRASAR